MRSAIALVDALLPGRSQPRPTALALTALVWGVLAVTRPDLIRAPALVYDQDHALLSLDLGINQALCGGPTKVSTLVRLPYEARDHAALRTTPIREALVARAGSVEQYCLTVGGPIINNENALMWLDAWILRLSPQASVDRVGGWLHVIRLLAIALLPFASLRLGAGLIAAGAATFSALIVTHQIGHLGLTSYPLDFALIVGFVSVVAQLAAGRTLQSRRPAVVTALILGSIAAFGANVRTSHLAVYLAVAGAAFGYAVLWKSRGAPLRHRLLHLVMLIAAAGAGYQAFQRLAINRMLPTDVSASPHHSTWHSIVLSLATPENALSRRESIAWSDGAAWELARRIRPDVGYLSLEYEQALAGYYRDLWTRDTDAMVAVYALKARTAGKQMIEVLRGGHEPDNRWLWWVLRPMDLLPHGGYLLAVYLALTAAGVGFAFRGSDTGVLVALLSGVAVLLHMESLIVTSLFLPHYHTYLAFHAVAVSLAAPAFVAAPVWSLIRSRVPVER